MKRDKYLNGILTINAALLGAIVWTQVSSQPLFTGEANAQTRSSPSRLRSSNPPTPSGVSSTGQRAFEQRDKIIALLNQNQETFTAMLKLMQTKSIKVEVTNAGDIAEANVKANDDKE